MQKQVHFVNCSFSLCVNISRLQWCYLVLVLCLLDQVVFREVVGFIRGPGC